MWVLTNIGSYPNSELCPSEGESGLDESGCLSDGLRNFTRGRRDELGLAVLHEGGESRLGEVWK